MADAHETVNVRYIVGDVESSIAFRPVRSRVPSGAWTRQPSRCAFGERPFILRSRAG